MFIHDQTPCGVLDFNPDFLFAYCWRWNWPNFPGEKKAQDDAFFLFLAA